MNGVENHHLTGFSPFTKRTGKGQAGHFARNLFTDFARMRTECHTAAAPDGRLTVAGAGAAEPLLLPGLFAGTGHFTLALCIGRTLMLVSLMGNHRLIDRLSALFGDSELVTESHFPQLLPLAIFYL